MSRDEEVYQIQLDLYEGRISQKEATNRLKNAFRGDYGLTYKKIRNSLGLNPTQKQIARQKGENIPQELTGYVNKVWESDQEQKYTLTTNDGKEFSGKIVNNENIKNTFIGIRSVSTQEQAVRESRNRLQISQSQDFSSPDGFFYILPTSQYTKSNIVEQTQLRSVSPIGSVLAESSNQKIGIKFEKQTITPKPPKQTTFLQEVFGIDPNKTDRRIDKVNTAFFQPISRQFKQDKARIELSPQYKKFKASKGYDLVFNPKSDTFLFKGIKEYIGYTYLLNKAVGLKLEKSDNKIISNYGKAQSFTSDLVGSASFKALDTYSTPSNWVLIAGTSEFLKLYNPAGDFLSSPPVSATLTAGYFGVVGTKAYFSDQPAITIGEGLGTYAGYYGIAKSYTGLKSDTTKYLKSEYKKFRGKYQDFTFQNLQRNQQLSTRNYFNYQDGSGQKNLFGRSVGKVRPISNQQGIGFGIEQNTMRYQNELLRAIKTNNYYFSTGQTKLTQDNIFALNRYDSTRFAVNLNKNKNAFVYDLSLNKFVEYTPESFKIFTQNPKYNIFSLTPQNPYSFQSFYKTQPSTQTTLFKKRIIDLTGIKIPQLTTKPNTKIDLPTRSGKQILNLVSDVKTDSSSFVGNVFTPTTSTSYTPPPPTTTNTIITPKPPIIDLDLSSSITPIISTSFNPNVYDPGRRKTRIKSTPDIKFTPFVKINEGLGNIGKNPIKPENDIDISSRYKPKINFNFDSTIKQAQKTSQTTKIVQDTTPSLSIIPRLTTGLSFNPNYDLKLDDPKPKDPDPPPPIDLNFPKLQFSRKKRKIKGIKTRSQYKPSLEAITFNIKGSKPSEITPFSLRPILKGSKKKNNLFNIKF